MLKEKKVTIDGTEFTVRELPLSKSAPIMKQLSEGDRFQAQVDLVLQCTFDAKGKPINGDEYGLTALEPLATAAMELHGWAEGKG